MSDIAAFATNDFFQEGNRELLDKVRPAFERLVSRLVQLGPYAAEAEKYTAFQEAFNHINKFEDEIETVERETILETMYAIGARVGLRRDTEFCERWRGDW